MVKVTMSENGTVKECVTVAYCDSCGAGRKWTVPRFTSIVSVSFAKSILRKDEGWRFGKKHLCGQCASKKKSAIG